MCFPFIALYHRCIAFHNSEFPSWNLLNLKRLQKELSPAVQRLYKQKNWIFLQDNAPQYRSNFVQDFLTKTFNSRFNKTHEWPLSSPDCNPLDYYFWNKVKEKVYENRLNKPFENKRELKKWMESVWKDIAFNLPEIWRARKQFARRLKAIKEREGRCIKMIYG